jgi:isopropylmalate/homocitrate/citramalate synthase
MKDSYQLWDNIKDNRFNKNFTMLVTDNNELSKSLNEGILSFGLLSSVSDSFGLSNLKKDSYNSFHYMMEQFNTIYNYDYELKNNYHVRIYLSCSFGSKKEKVDDNYLNHLYNFVEYIDILINDYKLSYKNVDIVLCDTMGTLNKDIYIQVLDKISNIPNIEKYISLHLHTDSDFYDYIDIALKYKIHKFDSSILGIGGCPFSDKKNVGNINTLQLIEYLEYNNYDTGIDYETLKILENDILKVIIDSNFEAKL